MIGPLLATACLSVGGVPTKSSGYLRNVGQWVIGAALGLYFTADVGQMVVSLWWAILLGIAWALAMEFSFGLWLHWHNAPHMPELSAKHMRATSYFAGAIGGASEMTIMSDRYQARTDLVAASHSLRLVLVVVCLLFGNGHQSWGSGNGCHQAQQPVVHGAIDCFHGPDLGRHSVDGHPL